MIDDVCIGICIDEGTYEHYISRARIKNDLHGAGAFILKCAEMQHYMDIDNLKGSLSRVGVKNPE